MNKGIFSEGVATVSATEVNWIPIARGDGADVVEVEFPVFVGLIGKMLRLAGDGIDLPTRSADLLGDSLANIAP